MNTIKRTSNVLRLLADSPQRFTDIAKELDLTKSTAHRLVTALEKYEFIKKNPLSGLYHLGPLISKLAANPTAEHQFLVVCAISEMRRLRDISGETVTLQVPLGTERICLEEIQSRESIKYVSGRGAIYPLFVGSAGKMLLSMFEDKQIKILLKKFYYDPSAPNPIKNEKDLWEQIRVAREKKFSTSFGERISGSASVAVPIYDYISPAILNILGPAQRFTKGDISEVLEEMKKSAAIITKEFLRLR